jgi:hypothetical protein
VKSIEIIIIGLAFIAALYYLLKTTFQSFFAKNNAGCAKGCGSCGAVDFDKIIKEASDKENQLA